MRLLFRGWRDISVMLLAAAAVIVLMMMLLALTAAMVMGIRMLRTAAVIVVMFMLLAAAVIMVMLGFRMTLSVQMLAHRIASIKSIYEQSFMCINQS